MTFPFLLAPLAGAGFALLIAASPLGQLRFKPFSCRVCLSGWGAIGATGPLWTLSHGWTPFALACWCSSALVGVGGAWLIFALCDALRAYADRLPGPLSSDVGLPPIEGVDPTVGEG